MNIISSVVYRALTALFAAIITVLSVKACGNTEQPANTTVENIVVDSNTDTIYILQSRGEIGQYLQQAVDEFSNTNPGARFSVQTVGNQADYSTALRFRLLSGERVDIFHIFSRRDMLELAPYLEDLSSLEWISGCVPGSLDAVTMDQSVYGIPYSLEGIGLIVNAEIFEKADIYLGNISTIEDLEEIFKQLQDKIFSEDLLEDFPNLEAVTEFSAQDKAYLGGPVANLALTGSFVTSPEVAEAVYLNMPLSESAEAFLRLMALYSSCTRWEQLNSVSQFRQIESGIAAGRVACVFQNAEIYRRVAALDPGLAEKLRILPVPLGMDNTPEGGIYMDIPAFWSVRAQSDETAKQTAKTFLTWLYQSDSGTAFLAGRFKALSPYRDAAMDTGLRLHSQIMGQIEGENMLPVLHREFPGQWGEEVFASGIQGYFSKELSWEKITQTAKESWHDYQAVFDLGASNA